MLAFDVGQLEIEPSWLMRGGKEDSPKLVEITFAIDQKERLPAGQAATLEAMVALKTDLALEITEEQWLRALT